MRNQPKSTYDRVFDGCVTFLENLASLMNPWWPGGMDYRKINVILFCICLPLILISSLVLNILLLLAL